MPVINNFKVQLSRQTWILVSITIFFFNLFFFLVQTLSSGMDMIFAQYIKWKEPYWQYEKSVSVFSLS